ncbi:MAG: hypothetical protein Q9171_001774 [Xanthocarpia ochracea]
MPENDPRKLAFEKPVLPESGHPEGMSQHSPSSSSQRSAGTDLSTASPVKLPDRRPDDHGHDKESPEGRVQLRGVWQSWWKGCRPWANRLIRKRMETAAETQHLRDASTAVGSKKRKFVEGEEESTDSET